MTPFFKLLFTTIPLLAACLLFQSCNEQDTQFEKQKVQFSLSPASTYSPGVSEIDLPENALARISVTGSNGTTLLSDHEISVYKSGSEYVTGPLELSAGTYSVTDFIIVADSIELYVTPKKGAEFSTSEADALPYNFSIQANDVATVRMQIMDVQNQDLKKFGYTSSKAKANSFPIAVYENIGGTPTLTSATAELHQNKTLLQVVSLSAAVNTIALAGNPKLPYTLTVYTATGAKTQTFNIKQLKSEIGKKPLQLVLDPALVLSIESYVEPGNEYEDFFEFRMEGNGSVNINWGDGEQTATTLPVQLSHEYFNGNYAMIITGDIDQVTDFFGFSYSTIIPAITGLTNLTSLKTYNPSWGAVPIKVDLSNCYQLETIFIEKYGSPYEAADLRTDFKLPAEHNIHTFFFNAPSFDINREFISAEELEVFVNNIYNNTINKQISNGKFFVNPVVTPSSESQQKLDFLASQYNWEIGFNDEIYNGYDSEAGRSSATDVDSRREQWLKARFSNSKEIIEKAHSVASMN